MPCNPVRSLTLVLVLGAVACADSQPIDPAPSTDLTGVPVELKVSLRNPAGDPICTGLPDGLEIDVGLIDEFSTGSYSTRTVTCPARQARFTLDSDTRYQVFIEQRDSIWPYARLVMKMDTLQLSADSVVPLRAAQGSMVGGTATLNGVPLRGESLLGVSVHSGYVDHFSLPSADTDSLGRWIDRRNGAPFRLQAGIAYARQCQADYGMRVVGGPNPNDVAVFPTDWRTVNCRFGLSNRRSFTHHATDLQLTPEPGVIDPRLGSDADGYGFGVVYPTGGALTVTENLLAYGALLFAGDTYTQIWTPWDRADLTSCNSSDPVACAMFVPRRSEPVVFDIGDGIEVRQLLADSTGTVPPRFYVAQTSFDGAYGDYVLYRITFRSDTGDHQTVYPAWYLDWNLTPDGNEDVAGSSPDGRLIYVTDGTRYLGSYVAEPAPIRARWIGHCCGIGGGDGSLAIANDIMRGFIINNSLGPADVVVAHGTILQLEPGETRTYWFALLGADSLAELEALAQLANDEAAIRHAGGTP